MSPNLVRLLDKGQASVLTVAIMIVMVVFSIYAMTEYSIIMQAPYSVASTISGNSNSSSEVASARSYESNSYSSGCLPSTLCGTTVGIQSVSSSQSAGKVAEIVTAGVSSDSAAIACPFVGEGRLILTTLADSGSNPLQGVAVRTLDTMTSCSNQKSIVDLGQTTTNSSGMVTICCNTGSYIITLDYETSSYSASANVTSGGLTCVSLLIPSGREIITYSAIVEDLCNHDSS